MAPVYKLYYFDVKGAGEVIRYLLSYGNLEFEDIRIKKEDWPQHKPNTPFGQLPVLEYKGKKVNQSIAICRYLAKQAKLTGKNDFEDLEIDAIVDTIGDFRLKFYQYRHETNETKQKELEKTFFEETLPFFFERFDANVKKNGYLVLDKLTWADIYFASQLEHLPENVQADVFNKYSNIKALVDKIWAIPSIKKWIETRPSTQNFRS